MIGLVVLVCVGIVAAILGVVMLFVSADTSFGVGFLVLACFLAIMARLFQSDFQTRRLTED